MGWDRILESSDVMESNRIIVEALEFFYPDADHLSHNEFFECPNCDCQWTVAINLLEPLDMREVGYFYPHICPSCDAQWLGVDLFEDKSKEFRNR